ncbi:MAG: ArnT family glycosyltransferase [Nitrospirales bacterium]
MDNLVVPPDSFSPIKSIFLRDLILLLALSSLMLLVGLGDIGLTDRDEGSNAEAAREMLETGDWISPTLNYEPRFAKPAFVYWIISVSYAVLGVNEFSARFPSALFGIGLILLQYSFLARFGGARIALFGSLILLLNLEMIGISRMVLTDPELVFFTTLATYGFWLGMESEQRKHLYFLGFYIGMGGGMLAKGPVGIIIPLLAVVPYLTITKQWGQYWKSGYPLLGMLLFAVIAAPWYIAMFMIHEEAYLAAAQANTTGRFANPMEGHGGTIFFYLPVLFLGFFPWSAFLPMSLFNSLKNWKMFRGRMHERSVEQKLEFFLGLWIIGLLIFFTLSSTRLPHYIFPLFPASAVLVALFWRRIFLETSPAGLAISIRILVILGYVFGLALATVPVAYLMFIEKMTKEFPAAAQMDVGILPVILGLIIIIGTMSVRYLLAEKEKRLYSFGVAGGMMAVFILMIVLVALPRFSEYFINPPQKLASLAGLNLKKDDRLIQFGRKRPSLTFYGQRKVYQINPGEDGKFVPHVNAPGRKMIVLQSHLRRQLPDSVSNYSLVLERDGFSLLASDSLIK